MRGQFLTDSVGQRVSHSPSVHSAYTVGGEDGGPIVSAETGWTSIVWQKFANAIQTVTEYIFFEDSPLWVVKTPSAKKLLAFLAQNGG